MLPQTSWRASPSCGALRNSARHSTPFRRSLSPLVRHRTAILALQGVGAPEADLAHHFDRATLLRFLRARPTVAKSAQMFVAMCAWYREYKPFEQANVQRDALRAGTSAEARVAHAYMPAGFHGLDKRGLPVYYGRYGVYDFAGVAREATFEVLMQAAMSTQLSSMAMNNAVSRARGKEYFTNVIVLDLNDVGVSMLKSAIPVFLKFVKVREGSARARALEVSVADAASLHRCSTIITRSGWRWRSSSTARAFS